MDATPSSPTSVRAVMQQRMPPDVAWASRWVPGACCARRSRPDAFDRLVFVLPADHRPARARTWRSIASMQMRAEWSSTATSPDSTASLVAEQPAERTPTDRTCGCGPSQARASLVHDAGPSAARAAATVPARRRVASSPMLTMPGAGDRPGGRRGAPRRGSRVSSPRLLPTPTLEVFDAGGVLWTHRAEVRARSPPSSTTPDRRCLPGGRQCWHRAAGTRQIPVTGCLPSGGTALARAWYE